MVNGRFAPLEAPLETISGGNLPCRIFDLGLLYVLPFCWASNCSFLSGARSGGGRTKRDAGRAGSDTPCPGARPQLFLLIPWIMAEASALPARTNLCRICDKDSYGLRLSEKPLLGAATNK